MIFFFFKCFSVAGLVPHDRIEYSAIILWPAMLKYFLSSFLLKSFMTPELNSINLLLVMYSNPKKKKKSSGFHRYPLFPLQEISDLDQGQTKGTKKSQ